MQYLPTAPLTSIKPLDVLGYTIRWNSRWHCLCLLVQSTIFNSFVLWDILANPTILACSVVVLRWKGIPLAWQSSLRTYNYFPLSFTPFILLQVKFFHNSFLSWLIIYSYSYKTVTSSPETLKECYKVVIKWLQYIALHYSFNDTLPFL